jgi:hypothetical protein
MHAETIEQNREHKQNTLCAETIEQNREHKQNTLYAETIEQNREHKFTLKPKNMNMR